MDSQKLFKCFDSPNKRRILNILKKAPMTPKDLTMITGFTLPYLRELLREFVEAGLIVQYKASHKLVIYMVHDHNVRLIPDYNSKPKNHFANHGIENPTIARGKILRRPKTNNFPTNFVGKVFSMFGFDDSQFKNDRQYIRKHLDSLRSIKYFRRDDVPRIEGFIKEQRRRKETRERNLQLIK